MRRFSKSVNGTLAKALTIQDLWHNVVKPTSFVALDFAKQSFNVYSTHRLKAKIQVKIAR